MDTGPVVTAGTGSPGVPKTLSRGKQWAPAAVVAPVVGSATVTPAAAFSRAGALPVSVASGPAIVVGSSPGGAAPAAASGASSSVAGGRASAGLAQVKAAVAGVKPRVVGSAGQLWSEMAAKAPGAPKGKPAAVPANAEKGSYGQVVKGPA